MKCPPFDTLSRLLTVGIWKSAVSVPIFSVLAPVSWLTNNILQKTTFSLENRSILQRFLYYDMGISQSLTWVLIF